MSRRVLTYAVVVVTSALLAACTQPTAPRRDDTAGCRNVTQGSSGYYCADN